MKDIKCLNGRVSCVDPAFQRLQEVVEDGGAPDKMRVDMMSRGVGTWDYGDPHPRPQKPLISTMCSRSANNRGIFNIIRALMDKMTKQNMSCHS